MGVPMEKKRVIWLSLNAKYSHTSLAIRYLQAACGEGQLLELTINDYLPDILGRIYECQPDILGIACYIWNIEMVKALLPLLRKTMPRLVLLCGGPEVSYGTADFLRQYPMVDYVIRGEGEEAAAALLAFLQRGEVPAPIAGVAYQPPAGGLVEGEAVTVPDLTSLPFPYTAADLAANKERILYYESSRGCPYSCAYCLSCATRGIRQLPLERVLAELQFFVAQDVRQVKFVDRTANADARHWLPILRFIAAQDCRTNFHFEIAADLLDEAALSVLQTMPAGRVQLEAGIQSTNPATLRSVARVNHWERLARSLQTILRWQTIHVHVDLIIGLPEEDMASLARSFDTVYALQPDMLQLGFLKFLKGAAMMELAAAGEYQYMDTAPYEVLSNRWLSYAEIRWLHSFEMVFGYYYNAGRCRRTLAYLIREAAQGQAFAFYRELTQYWEMNGWHHCGHSVKELYGCLLRFACQQYALPRAEIDSLLRLDALLTDGGTVRPAELSWNRQRYQTLTAAFWRSTLPERYIPQYRFTNWRDIRQHYHIEIFDYAVDCVPEQRMEAVPTALLFMFAPGKVEMVKLDYALLAKNA